MLCNGKEKNNKYRHEYKYYINMADYMALRQRLPLIAKSDTHVGSDGRYRMRSLHFETFDKIDSEIRTGINSKALFDKNLPTPH